MAINMINTHQISTLIVEGDILPFIRKGKTNTRYPPTFSKETPSHVELINCEDLIVRRALG